VKVRHGARPSERHRPQVMRGGPRGGFTHYCANGRDGGGFILGRKPVRTRMRSKLREIKGHLQVDVRSFLIFGRWVLC
jgi:hypothetical protein